MNFPDVYRELRSAIRTLAKKEIAPYAADVDARPRFPTEALEALNSQASTLCTSVTSTAGTAPMQWQPASSSKKLHALTHQHL
ncbi:acyl-CoA dehydrogenase family protein [Mycolicibacterium goodii]|nr:acyl-CoA dehydrogenase family protein [Mycolicibacterium goodii]